ncbi:unnamed protein product [Meloidogyne enterolobii]|uniref:Uncharacterized protein n=2 Tax=Meloidogyne enterolobii TaxID=390850 RepID=A0A6V7V696_MELEN|nr:unnamed protein product [Meloidogyne enterolobii]
MCSNFNNLTTDELTSDTSLISTEDEFFCVNRPKMKEIGTMTSETNIPKVEQNSGLLDVLIIILNFIADFFKLLVNKAKNIKLSKVVENLAIFLALLMFLLFFIQAASIFWYIFSGIVFEGFLFEIIPCGRLWSVTAIFVLTGFILVLFFLVTILHEFLKHIDWIERSSRPPIFT